MLKLIVTRHGETEWNTVRRMQGHHNSPLTQLGINQSLWLAERLKDEPIARIYSSPLERAMVTSQNINAFHNVDIVPADELKEINIGQWTGRLIEDVMENESDDYNHFWNEPHKFHMEGTESFESVQERAGAFVRKMQKLHDGETILIVAHAIILKGMMNYLRKGTVETFWDGPHIYPASLTKIELEGDRVEFKMMSDTAHYQEEMKFGWFVDADK